MPATGSPTSAAVRPSDRARLFLFLGPTSYSVRPLTSAELTPGVRRGFRLKRVDARFGAVRYLVTAGSVGFACSCGDSRYRSAPAGRPFKHLRAVRACGLL